MIVICILLVCNMVFTSTVCWISQNSRDVSIGAAQRGNDKCKQKWISGRDSVKKTIYFADVIYGWPLEGNSSIFSLIQTH